MTPGGVVTADRLKEIEARERAATEGPWSVDPAYPGVIGVPGDNPESEWDQTICELDDDENALFIAHAREDIPYLCAALRAAHAALKDEMKWDMGGVPENEWKRRAEAAEARLAVYDEAHTEADGGDSIWRVYDEKLWRSLKGWKTRAEAAEARAERLKGALREIRDMAEGHPGIARLWHIANNALTSDLSADEETGEQS